jgi:hypothetical protein
LEDEPTSDIPFDLEEGNRVWATGLLPKAEYVQATSTISQRLAETFAKNTDPHPTLPTGGRGSKDPVPDYVKMFSQVFSEEGFAKLPTRKLWDHAIELVPGAQPKGCKVYLSYGFPSFLHKEERWLSSARPRLSDVERNDG